MRRRLFFAVVLAAFANTGKASPTTYTVVTLVGAQWGGVLPLTSTITTDGKIGSLTASDILSWDWVGVARAVPAYVDPTNPAMIQISGSVRLSDIIVDGLAASATQLTVSPSGIDGLSPSGLGGLSGYGSIPIPPGYDFDSGGYVFCLFRNGTVGLFGMGMDAVPLFYFD